MADGFQGGTTRNGVDRAAIFLLTLGEKEAAEVLRHMSPQDVQLVGTAMTAIADVTRDEINDVMSTFMNEAERQTSLGSGTTDFVRKALIGAGTNKEPGGNIPPNHAYAIFGFDAERDMVITWNPWHNDFTPKGPSNRENGYARKKGVAEIPLADFVQIFNTLQIETDQPFDANAPRKAVQSAKPDPAAATR